MCNVEQRLSADEAATRIQSALRGFTSRRTVERSEAREQIFLGMQPPVCSRCSVHALHVNCCLKSAPLPVLVLASLPLPSLRRAGRDFPFVLAGSEQVKVPNSLAGCVLTWQLPQSRFFS